MKRTVVLKLDAAPDQTKALADVRAAFADACNHVSGTAFAEACFNRVRLHHLVYYDMRASSPLGSQMVCQAIRKVSDAYRALIAQGRRAEQPVAFGARASVRYDKRTYRLTEGGVSLYTLGGRIVVGLVLGDFQRDYLERGAPKEAELCQHADGCWYLHLVLDLPDTEPVEDGDVLGVDLGENNLAATSTGRVFGGGALRDRRDRHLALRRRLQANGSQSARQRLRHASGRERRHMRQVNHETAKAIVAEAVRTGASTIALERLTNIRDRIRADKRTRTRLHRWAWRELQTFVAYKAEAAGIAVTYCDPAYTSVTCSGCGARGSRSKHRFRCQDCGIQRHSDVNAASNLRRIVSSAELATGTVGCPHVGPPGPQ